MAGAQPEHERREFSQESDSLVRITLAPVLWAAHFALSYASTAVYCAKFADAAGMAAFRIGLGVFTVVVLIGIAWLGWRAWQQWDAAMERSAREVLEDLVEEEEDRHNFLGHAAFLLAIISFVGVVYTALPVAIIGTCR